MNITLSVDERVVAEARRVAASMGKSLNQLVRDYLETLRRQSSVEEELAELEALSRASGGKRDARVFDREEAHARS